MGDSCAIHAKCKNGKTSQLHKDLLSLGETAKDFTRAKANQALYLSRSETFLKQHQENLSFDENGEPKLASFYMEAKQAMPEVTYDDVAQALAKKFQFGVKDFNEAVQVITEFNKNAEGGNTFMATIEIKDNGQYECKVVFANEENKEALVKTIQDRLFAEEIQQKLNAAGVGITVSDDKISSYDTRNPKRIVDGYWGLIQLHKGLGNLHSLYAETGHFLVDAIGYRNPLIQRLLKTFQNNPQIIEDLLGIDEASNLGSEGQNALEGLGHLVGKYLEEYQQEDKGFFKTIGNMIMRCVKWLGTKIPIGDRQYRRDLYNAEVKARAIAKSFLNDTFEQKFKGSVNRALKSNSILHDLQMVPYNKFLMDMKSDIQELIKLQKELDIAGADTSNLRDAIKDIFASYNEAKKQAMNIKDINSVIDPEVAAWKQRVTTLLNQILDTYSIDLVRTSEQLVDVAEDIDQGIDVPLNKMATVVKRAELLLEFRDTCIHKYVNRYEEIIDEHDRKKFQQRIAAIQNYTTQLNAVDTSMQTLMYDVQQKTALKFLVMANGSEFIAIEQSVRSASWKRASRAKERLVDLQEELEKSSTVGTGNWWSRWIDAMADSPDIINQLVAKAIETEKYKANLATQDAKDHMLDLYERMRKEGMKSSDLFETMPDGTYSGNIKSERHWGKWEKDYDDWKKKTKEDFWELNSNGKGLNFSTEAQAWQSSEFISEFGDKRKQWHNEHSSRLVVHDADGNVKVDENGEPITCWAPALAGDDDQNRHRDNKYTYEGQLDFTGNKLNLYNEYMTLKRRLDDKLRMGATNMFGVRAPQFKAKMFDRRQGFMTRWKNTFDFLPQLANNPDDVMFGSQDDTYGEDDLVDSAGYDIYDTNFKNSLNTLSRVPIYGVRKIDGKLLSTDIVFSTIAYAQMANNYEKLQNVTNAALLTSKQVARNRVATNDNKRTVTKDYEVTDVNYLRMQDYIRMVVYNNYSDEDKKWGKKWKRKMLSKLGSLVTYLRLGWNYNSAIVNAMTGMWEIQKEAGLEEYSQWDMLRAMWTYLGNWVKNLGDNTKSLGNRAKPIEGNSKMSLLKRKFDFNGEMAEHYREYRVNSIGYGFLKGRNMTKMSMWLFSMTEDWMSTVPALASMYHTKVRNKYTGKVQSLYSIYTVKNGKLAVINDGKESDWEVQNWQQGKINELIGDDYKSLNTSKRDVKLETVSVKNEEYDATVMLPPAYTLDGVPVPYTTLGIEDLKYYTEYADNSDPERKVYVSYSFEKDPNVGVLPHKVNTKVWVAHPTTNNLIPVQIKAGGDLIVNYEGNDMSLNEFYEKTAGKQLRTDTNGNPITYTQHYTQGNLFYIMNKQTYLDENGNSTGITKYLRKTDYKPWDNEAQTQYRMRVRAINNRLHGVYNKMDQGAYARVFLGPIIASLKKYAIGLIDRKFARARIDLRTGKVRQGSFISFYNTIQDAFATRNDIKNAKDSSFITANKFDEIAYSWKPKNWGTSIAKLVLGTMRLALVCGASLPAIRPVVNAISRKVNKNNKSFLDNYFQNRGFAEIQQTNVARVWNDQIKLLLIYALMAWAGGDDDDDEYAWEKWLSSIFMQGFIFSSKLWPKELTLDDDQWFTEENLTKIAQSTGTTPFKFRDILFELLYRTALEQEAYNLNPYCFDSFVAEFENLTTNEFPAVAALLDTGMLIASLVMKDTVSFEELAEMKQQGKDISGYALTKDGTYKKVIKKGTWKGWSKSQKAAFNTISPAKTFMPFFLGKETKKSAEYFRKRSEILSKWGF